MVGRENFFKTTIGVEGLHKDSYDKDFGIAKLNTGNIKSKEHGVSSPKYSYKQLDLYGWED